MSILRGFSAPVSLKMQRDNEELAFLLRYDNDTFNRWEAGQQLAAQVIFRLMDDWRANRPLQMDP